MPVMNTYSCRSAPCCASTMPCGASGNANGCVTFRYAVYVLEAANSNRLVYFLPPLVSFKYFCLQTPQFCTPSSADTLKCYGLSSSACISVMVGCLEERQAFALRCSLQDMQWPQVTVELPDRRIMDIARALRLLVSYDLLHTGFPEWATTISGMSQASSVFGHGTSCPTS